MRFTSYNGKAVILNIVNIDTDAIIPKQFLQNTSREGFGKHLFHDWRFIDGDPTTANPEFPLNDPENKGAGILITGKNFGCGSSREHAPWALKDYGFRVIIAPSFADIFYNNAFNIGLLPIILNETEINEITDHLSRNKDQKLSIDLERQTIQTNSKNYFFEISKAKKEILINGNDPIEQTLKSIKKIHIFEAQHPSFL